VQKRGGGMPPSVFVILILLYAFIQLSVVSVGNDVRSSMIFALKVLKSIMQLDWPPESPDNQYHLNK
ncbi:hypothetical protein, partial [Escherichia coli]|uniref:hypothetical protein n=1 Tax=Escherichia coli TaxID=562 RepID=UPI0030C6EC05